MIIHNIDPIYSQDSETLILGSFPSVKSRDYNFFYAHPQNRFWKVLAGIFCCDVPVTTEQKKHIILSNRLALWDVIHSCNINGSSDNSITEVIPNDMSLILKNANIKKICCNGSKSYELYNRFLLNDIGIQAEKLPSTSPANASWSLERLIKYWEKIII